MEKGLRADIFKRLVVSALVISVLVGIFLMAAFPWGRPWVFTLVGLFALVAQWEFYQLARVAKIPVMPTVGLGLTAASFLAFYSGGVFGYCQPLPPVVFSAGLFVIFLFHMLRVEGSLISVAVTSLGLLYVMLPFGILLFLLFSPAGTFPPDGRWWAVYLVLVTKSGDIGAYFCGKSWGRWKLAPRISPGKTIEGFLGGALVTVGVSILFTLFQGAEKVLSWERAIFLGLGLAVLGQLGDLSESLFKRDVNVKDSSRIPGLGGILDMMDSLLFTTPALYLYLLYFI